MNRHREHGIALLLSVLALLLLSAVAVGMIYMASTENSIAANFKSEETEYFAARAGVEEVRDRMIPGVTNSISALLPTTLPTSANQQVLYVLQKNPSSQLTMSNITSGSPSTNPYYDDELCHDYTMSGMTNTSANIRCTTQPSGSWYSTSSGSTLSAAPSWTSGSTSNPLDWKWTRVTLKATNSTSYCVDSSNTYCTSATAKAVCYNGISEQVMTGASCTAMGYTPVYLVTSLATNATSATNATAITGARRLVQAELAQSPVTGNQPGGLFATGTGCSPAPLSFGGNVATGSFSSAGESATNPTFPTLLNSGGDVGANGGISVGGTSAAINGNVASTLPPGTTGCPLAITKSGSPTIGGETQIPSAFIPITPTVPSSVPQTACTVANSCITTNQTCTTTGKKTTCTTTGYSLAPGTYGNISIGSSTVLNLQGGTTGNPAVYNINSLSEAGQASISISGPPYGPIVVNIAGGGQTTVLDLTGGGFANNSYVPGNLTFNYGGTGNLKLAGGSSAFFVVNAPKASLTLTGNSTFYGSAVANTINVQGSSSFYWDTATVPPPTVNTGTFNVLAMRELSY